MNIGVTERPEYKRCRRRWLFGSRNRMALTPIVPATALSLGTYVHAALAAWRDDPSINPKVAFVQAAATARVEAIATYREQVGAGISDSEIVRLDDAILMGAFMVENYQKHWGAPLPPEFRTISQEQRIAVPIPGTEHTEEWLWDNTLGVCVKHTYAEPRLHYLEGRLDGIIQDRRNRLYVLDSKTYNMRPKEYDLKTSDQFISYTWILKQLDMGYPVAGVAYDGLWKRAAVPKTVDGRKGVLADLFLRMPIEFAPEELEDFESELRLEALEMASNPAIYKNRSSDGSCHWGCGFDPLCLAVSRGEDVSYVLRSRYTHKIKLDAELEQADAETGG